MDREEFQEKMDPAHRQTLCRMLKVKDLPELVLRVYLKVKTLTDRIDARLLPGNLAVIAMIGSETLDTDPTGAEAEAAIASGAAKPVGAFHEADDQVLENTLEQSAAKPAEPPAQPVAQGQVSGVTGQALGEVDATRESVGLPTAQEQERPAAQQVGTGVPWAAGMPVNVLQDDELNHGKIVGVHPPEPGSDKPVRLTVECDGGQIVTVNEDEVEAD